MKRTRDRDELTKAKLIRAAKLATADAKRENKALGLTDLIVKDDGLYLVTKSGKLKLHKKGNYKPIKVTRRRFKLA